MADAPSVKRKVGRYEIVRTIGRGGMAVVYLARQEALERDVALKELSSFHATAPHAAERFLQESRLAGSLSHPNILTVYEYFDEEGLPYIAMEYVRRGSLRPYVGLLSLAQMAGVMEGVLAGLAHAETYGIVHRDLKPENLMVTSDGRVKITDFGIAKATQRGTGLFVTAAGATVGTPTYMAPEQAMAQELGPWTDLYSVGIMAWEHVVGRTPFHDTSTAMAILMRQMNEQIPSVIDLKPDADPELSAWIGRLLVKDPRERTRSSAAAWDELEEIVISRLGPRWRRQARLPPPAEVQDKPKPLTPAPFESKRVRTPKPASQLEEQSAESSESGYMTFGRYAERATPSEPAPRADAEVVPSSESPPPSEDLPVSAKPMANGPETEASSHDQVLGVAPDDMPGLEDSAAGHITFERAPEPLAQVEPITPAGPPPDLESAAPTTPLSETEASTPAEPEMTFEPAPPAPAAAGEASKQAQPVAEVQEIVTPGRVAEREPDAESAADSKRPLEQRRSGRSAPRRPRRLPLAILGVASLVAVSIVLAVVLLGRGSTPARPATRLLWQFHVSGHVSSTPAVAGGLVIFGSRNGQVYAVDARTGRLRWDFQTGEIVQAGEIVFSSPVVSGRTVYIGSNARSLYALDLNSGKRQWRFQTHGAVESSPVVAGNTVYVGSDDSRVYAVDARTGAERWQFRTGQPVFSSPGVSHGVVFVGSRDGQVYALDASRGTKVWQFHTGDQVWSSPALATGVVYIGSNDRHVYALDQRTGHMRWRFRTGDLVSSSPCVHNGRVFVGSFDHNVYALDALSGKEIWHFRTGNVVFSSPAVSGGTVYVGSHDHHVYALDAATGQLRWAFKTKTIVASPSVAGGAVFIGSDDGNLYALNARVG